MKCYTYESGREAYAPLIRQIFNLGEKRSPRGQETLDLGPTTITLFSPMGSLPLDCNRSLSRRVAAVEALQLIGGFSSPNLTLWASPNFRAFVEGEPDPSFYGAYGRRIGYQLAQAIDKIKRDRDTRQAVITLWDPTLDNDPGHKDYPCTVMLHLGIRGGRLELNTVMRSNDIWWGVPYDFFQFTQLQCTVANILGIDVGPYQHTTMSLHMYARNFDEADVVELPASLELQPAGFSDASLDETVNDVMRRVRSMEWGQANPMTWSEGWYADVISKYSGTS